MRKGAPKREDGNRPGTDLRHFRATFDERETEAAKTFLEHYGTQPTEMDVLLPFNDISENFDAWREAYVAGGLVHCCDGERVWYEVNPATGECLVTNGEPTKKCDGSAGCKPTGRLKIIVPQLQRLAHLTVLTTSIHDIMNLHRQLEALLQISGKLAGIPLKLRRRPVKVSTPSGDGGKRARREKWLLSIEADAAWVKAQLQAMTAAALPGNGLGEDVPLLEAPEEPDEPEDEEAEITSVVPLAEKPAPQRSAPTNSTERPPCCLNRESDRRAFVASLGILTVGVSTVAQDSRQSACEDRRDSVKDTPL